MWDFKVVESGQTAWQHVRFAYLWRQFDETWYYNVATGVWDIDAPAWYQVHNIKSANAVWDPSKVVGPYSHGPDGIVQGDEISVGMQFEASKDGVHWKPLLGAYAWENVGISVNSPTQIFCAHR
jgi:hypothetical protein